MSVNVKSLVQQATALLSKGFSGHGGRKLRQRRRNHSTASFKPVFAAAENLEHRQLLAAANVSVISASGRPGDSVEVPIRVTLWNDLSPSEALSSFEIYLTYDTVRLDLAAADISIGGFFSSNNWTLSANVTDADGRLSIIANSPTGQATPVPDALPDLVLISFSISPDASAGSATLDLQQDPDGFTTLYNGNISFDTFISSGQVTVLDGGGGGGGGGGPEGPQANNDPDPGAPGFSTNEDTQFITGNVLVNDTDSFGGALSVFSFTQPQRGPESAGSVQSLGDGTFRFTPGTDFNFLTTGQTDVVTFEYVIQNQFSQKSAPAVVEITVSGINDTPTISSVANQTMLEDSIISNLSFTVSDPDDATLAVQVSSNNTTLFPAGSLSLSGSGNNRQLSINPAANLSGEANVTLTVSDGVTSATRIFTVTVQPVNDAPQISDITGQSTQEDTPILNIPFSVTDIDNPALSVSLSVNSSTLFPPGSLTITGSGSNRFLSINPAANASGQATITVTVNDGFLSDSTSFDVFVNAVNDPPSISDVADQTTNEDVPITGVQFTVSDVEDDVTVTVTSTNPLLLPAGSVVAGGSGTLRTLTINPAANVSGSAEVTLTVSDGQASSQTTFSLVVNAVNDAPVLSLISDQTVPEDGVLNNIPFTVVDVDGDSVSLSLGSSNTTLLPLSAIVLSGTGSSRQVSITPTPGLSGTATVTIFATDGQDTTSRSFTVNVTAVNDPPVVSSIDAQSMNEDSTLSAITFSVADEDSTSLNVSVGGNNAELLPPGSLIVTGTGSSRQLSITPAANRFGTAVVTVTVSDGQASATSSFNLTVNSVNDAPSAAPDATSVRADQSVTIAVLGNDSDIDGTLIPATVEIVTPPTIGTATPNPDGTITYTPGGGSAAVVTFSYRVSDNQSAFSAPAVVSVNVITNVSPVISPVAPQSLSVGGAGLQIPLLVSDADNDPLQITVASSVPGLLSNLTLTGTGSNRILQLAPGTRPGLATITVTASDGVNAPVTRSFGVSVGLTIDAGAARNIPGVMTHRGYANSVAVPFSTSATITGVPEGVPATLFRTNVFDNPGRPELLFSIPTVAGQAYDVDLFFAEIWSGAFGVGRRVFDVMLEGNLAIDNLDVFAVAGRNSALTRSFQVIGDGNLSIELLHVVQNPNVSGIRVRPVTTPNTAPTITPVAAQQTSEDSPITGLEFSVADAEEQPLTVTVSSADTQLLPAAGLVLTGTAATRQLAITPAPNRFGTTQVTLSVSDGRATTTTSFAVTVNSVNDAPTATSDNATTQVDTAVTIPVLINDSDLDGTLNPGSVAIAQQSSNGTAVPNSDGSIRFTPASGFAGTATFTYTVRDDLGGESLPATVSVLVRNNTAPVISAIAGKELNIGTSSGPIAFTVTDTDGDNLTITATAADSSIVRTVAVTGTGSNRQLSITAGDFAGLTSITISVSDGFNSPVTRTVPVSVFALIDAGTATPTAGALSDRGFQNGAGSRFVGGSAVSTTLGSIAASVPDLFYRTILFDEVGGGDLGFDVKAKAGQTFAVDLFFAEVWAGAQGRGRRVFDVLLDGTKVLSNFDTFREANGGNIGISRRFTVQSDGNIDIDLRRLVQNPAIAGIRVTPVVPSER